MLDVVFAEDFGDDFEPGFVLRGLQQAQPFFAEALEFVGRGAGFVSAAAQDGRARGFHRTRRREQLLLAFHAARAGHDDDVATADFHAIDIDNGVLGMRLARHEFVPLLHAQDFLNLRHGGEGFERVVRALVAEGGDDGLLGAENRARVVAEFLHFGDDFIDERTRGAGFEDDDHGEKLSVEC